MPSDSINSLLAGTTGGIAVTFVGHGFDTVKVKLQTSTSSSVGLFSTISTIYKEGGIAGFYTGVGSPLAGQMFYRSILFLSHNEVKKVISSPSLGSFQMQQGTFASSFTAGMLAGGAATIAESPVDFFKTQKQVRASKDNVFVLGKKLIDKFGVKVAYQGATGTFLRNLPANGFYFGTFEEMKRINPLGLQSNFTTALVAGGVGGVMYWLACYPLDVIKSAMQSRDPGSNPKLMLSWSQTASSLWKEGGAKRFTRGLAPCLARAAVANSVMLTTVDTVKDFLKQK